jgi:hypothetical protein
MPRGAREINFDDIDFTSEAEREYFQEALLGERVYEFLNSEVGRYLHGRAKQEREEAKEQLIVLGCKLDSTYGRRKIKQYSDMAENADNFMRWCADAITSADEATKMLRVVREEDN